MGRLEDKVAIITGGSGGIGAAAARLFVSEGCNVILADINEAALQQLAGELGHENADYIVADVTSPEHNQAMVKKALERFGKVNVFLANAGIEGVVKPLHEYPLETFERVIAINVKGVFIGLQSVIPAMLQAGGGSTIITSSVAGLVGSPGFSAYVASKHAVIGMMRSAALEYGSMGIRVNTINPGPIETRMMRSIEEMAAPGAGAQVKAGFEAQVALKRYGLPEEVARLMLFLASDESSYITGNTYVIDGGFTAA